MRLFYFMCLVTVLVALNSMGIISDGAAFAIGAWAAMGLVVTLK